MATDGAAVTLLTIRRASEASINRPSPKTSRDATSERTPIEANVELVDADNLVPVADNESSTLSMVDRTSAT